MRTQRLTLVAHYVPVYALEDGRCGELVADRAAKFLLYGLVKPL
jgi:hypothetical protein